MTSVPSIRDVPAICRLARHGFDLSLPDRGTAWLAQSAGRQRFSMLRGDSRIRVARMGRQIEAAAVFSVTGPDARWNLDLLALREEDDDRAADAVLRRGVKDAGQSGTRRLYARMPDHVNDEGALRRSGFVPYLREHILRRRDDAAVPERPMTTHQVRRIHPADVWGIHQLYLEIVPRQVQYAEAMTSRAWEGLKPLRPGMRRVSGWVLEDHGRIRAFARISTMEHPSLARLDLLVAPEMRRVAGQVIDAALAETTLLHGVPCIAVIPGYEGELVQMLEDLQFEHEGTQTAFVCYTTVSARSPMIVVDHWAEVEAQPAPVALPGLGTVRVSVVTGRSKPIADVRVDHGLRNDP